jgi:hypothetical protein
MTYSNPAFSGTTKGEEASKQESRELHAELFVGLDKEGDATEKVESVADSLFRGLMASQRIAPP